MILCVNKWDAVNAGKSKFLEDLRDELKFLDYAPVVFISAKERKATRALFPLIQQGLCNRRRSASAPAN